MKPDPTKSYFRISVKGRQIVLGVCTAGSEQFATLVAGMIDGKEALTEFEPISSDHALVTEASDFADYDGAIAITLGKECELRMDLQMRPVQDAPSGEVYELYGLMATENARRGQLLCSES